MSRIEDASEQLRWLIACAGEDEPCGFDLTEWDAHTWILHAMYEAPALDGWGSQDEWHRQRLQRGEVEPLAVGGVDLNAATIDTGIPLGFAARPEGEWRRLLWRDYLDRFPQEDTDNSCPPCYRWFPSGSWPLAVRPPPEGSLDGESLEALIRTLGLASPGGAETECYAHYGPFSAGSEEGSHLWRGPLGSVPDLIEVRGGQYTCSPSNFWAADRSWFVWTDWDLQGTKVSGSRELVTALEHREGLETVAWREPST